MADWDAGEGSDLSLRDGVASQSFMQTLGAQAVSGKPGEARIAFAKADGLLQQNGFLHAGVATAIADTACGYAALSMAPPGHDVLTIEFKSNFLRPASGDRFEAVGRILKPGRQVAVVEGEVWETEPQQRLIMKMMATMMIVPRQENTAPGNKISS